MMPSLWRQHVLPFALLLGLLAVTALGGDYLLHRFNLVWVGRYLGIPGTVLIIGSLIYSLRKRKYIKMGKLTMTYWRRRLTLSASLATNHRATHYTNRLQGTAASAIIR
jgi:hypothetical protein